MNQEQAGAHFTPRPSFKADEIAFRKEQAGTGALMHQMERDGIEVATRILSTIEDPNERAAFAKIVGGSLLGSAGYIFEQYSQYLAMRHNLEMPRIATKEGIAFTPEAFNDKLFHDLGVAARLSDQLALVRREKLPVGRLPMQVARAHGRAALNLAMWPLPLIGETSRPSDVQDMVFESAIDMRSAAVSLSKATGTRTSVAQFTDIVSPLNVHVLRTAPPAVAEGLEASLAEQAAA